MSTDKKTTYTAARERANKKWAENNKDRRRYLSYRSTCRTFINNYAEMEDLAEIIELVEKREQILKK